MYYWGCELSLRSPYVVLSRSMVKIELSTETTGMEIKKQDAKDKIVSLFGVIESNTVESVIKDLTRICLVDDAYRHDVALMAAENGLKVNNLQLDPIQFHLCTVGGSCYEGLALYDTIASSHTPIEIICQGRVMSMGVIVALASNVRKAYANTTFMIHQVSGLLFGYMQDMKESLEEVQRLNEIMFSIITQKTSIKKETLTELIEHKRDWFLTAKEALDLGLITELIN